MKDSRSVDLDLEKVMDWMSRERWNSASLARRLKVDPSTMYRYLTGKQRVPYMFILAICALSGKSEEEFTRTQAA